MDAYTGADEVIREIIEWQNQANRQPKGTVHARAVDALNEFCQVLNAFNLMAVDQAAAERSCSCGCGDIAMDTQLAAVMRTAIMAAIFMLGYSRPAISVSLN